MTTGGAAATSMLFGIREQARAACASGRDAVEVDRRAAEAAARPGAAKLRQQGGRVTGRRLV